MQLSGSDEMGRIERGVLSSRPDVTPVVFNQRRYLVENSIPSTDNGRTRRPLTPIKYMEKTVSRHALAYCTSLDISTAVTVVVSPCDAASFRRQVPTTNDGIVWPCVWWAHRCPHMITYQVRLHLALCPSSSCLIIRWQFVQPYKTVGLVSPW